MPAPSGGDITSTAKGGDRASAKPVALDKKATSGGVVVELSEIKAVSAKAQLPGEVGGPGLLLTVRVRNDSASDLELDALRVTVADSTGAPAGEMTAAPNDPMTGVLAPGKSAVGRYLFTIKQSRRQPVVVDVALPTTAPVLVFRGAAPR